MTKCNAEQLEFHALGRRAVVGKFDGGMISTDGGGLLLAEVEVRTGMVARLAEQFTDHRDSEAIEHSVRDLVTQRVLGLALGYEDLNDHNQGAYCYLPLYIFCGEHLLRARLRESDIDACAGSVEELECIVGQIRVHWPETRIVIRGDSGFCREEIMAWCESRGVDFVLGLAKNARLLAASLSARVQGQIDFLESGEPSRVFGEFDYMHFALCPERHRERSQRSARSWRSISA